MMTVLDTSEMSALECRACLNLGGCLLARVDGKSPVEYLTDASQQELVRRVGWQALTENKNSLAVVRESMLAELPPEN